MAWTFWKPSKPLNLTGTLATGVATSAPLLANTTYYFKVVGWDWGNTTTTRYSLNQSSPQIYSEYSDTFSITTTATDRKVNLTWDPVLKRNGITQIDGYEVLISTSDDFTTNVNGDKFACFPSDFTYFPVCTATNSAQVTKVPAVGAYWKKIPNGMPLCMWDGASTCTFKSLYDAMKATAGYEIFAEKMTTFDTDNVLAYHFYGYISIARYTGDATAGVYSFTSNNECIFINGGIYVANLKYYLNQTAISLLGSTHSGSTGFFILPNAGSVTTACTFRYSGGSKGVLNAKSWGGTGQSYAPVTSANLRNVDNLYMNWDQTSEGTETPESFFNGTSSASILNSQEVWNKYYNVISSGRQKRIICNDTYFWINYHGLLYGYEVIQTSARGNNYQGQITNYVDCIWRYKGVTGVTDQDGWDHLLALNGAGYPYTKNSQFFIGKTIIPTVIDVNGDPIAGATVVLRNSSGVNITRPSSIAGVCKVAGATVNATTYDVNEVTIKHDNESVYLYEEPTWVGGITTPVVGNYYWYGAEKVKVLERIGTADPLQAKHKLYRLQRGIDGTPKGWMIAGNASYDIKLVEAPDSLTTDANGKTNTVGMFRCYKCLSYQLGGTGTRLLSGAVTAGEIVLYDQGDLTLTVSKAGYKTQHIVLTAEQAQKLGTEIYNLEITMEAETFGDTTIIDSTLIDTVLY